jgi:predicted Fe-S protein YdhL (DUF1289 family)
MAKINTPCIGICSTVFGDVVCRGCKRFVQEVINWNAFSEQEKDLVNKRLAVFLGQVMESRFLVVDGELLHEALDSWQIPYNSHYSDLCCAYSLLKEGAAMTKDFSEYGLEVLPGFEQYTAPELKQQIDTAFYTLSEAHYQRYVGPVYARSDEPPLPVDAGVTEVLDTI